MNSEKKDNINNTDTESVIKIKRTDYKNIVDKAIDHQYTIDVLSKLISKSNDMKNENIQNKESMEEIKNNESEKKDVENQNNNETDESKHSISSIFVVKKKNVNSDKNTTSFQNGSEKNNIINEKSLKSINEVSHKNDKSLTDVKDNNKKRLTQKGGDKSK